MKKAKATQPQIPGHDLKIARPSPTLIKNALVAESMESLHRHPAINSLLQDLFEKDPYTYDHCHRVGDMSQWIAQCFGLDPTSCVEVYLSGLLHDIGKIYTPSQVLKKPGPLTPEEFAEIKKHPVDSGELVKKIKDIAYLAEPIRGHHERIDGKGYPDQKKGDEIHLYSRIILVADTFDAMTSTRVYRKSLDLGRTYDELLRCSGTQFDPEAAKIFVAAHQTLSNNLRDQKKAA